jgi:DNA-binding SARP family transcriptional activator
VSIPSFARSGSETQAQQAAAGSQERPVLYLKLLGDFRIGANGILAEPQGWRLRKALTLVKYLALAPSLRLHREVVIDRLWRHFSPSAAENNLRQTLHAARRSLAAVIGPSVSVLRLIEGMVVLGTADEVEVDVVEFERAAARARAERSRAAYAEALARYAGELLPNDLYDDAIAERREELRALQVALLVGLAKVEANSAQLTPAVANLEVALRVDPSNPEASAARLQLLDRMGGRTEGTFRDRALSDGPRASINSPITIASHRYAVSPTDKTHNVLSEPERALLARVSVFQGGWDLDTSEAVVTDRVVRSKHLLGLLGNLTEKSLVRPEATDRGTRFGLPEAARAYAGEQLVQRGEDVIYSRRHATYFAHLSIAADAGLITADQDHWIAMFRRESANFDRALTWSLGNEEWSVALELGRHLWMFWSECGRLFEGRRWLQRILTEVPETPSEGLADVLNGAGTLARQQDDYEASLQFHRQGLAMQRKLGDERGTGFSLNNLGLLHADRGKYGDALILYREGLAVFERRGDSSSAAAAHLNIGRLASAQGDATLARREFETARVLLLKNGDERGVGYALQNVAGVDLEDNHLSEAGSKLRDARTILAHLADRQGVAYCDRLLGDVAFRRHNLAVAASHWREALAALEELGDQQGLAVVLEDVAMLAWEYGNDRLSCHLAAGADCLRGQIGSPPAPKERRRLAALRMGLAKRQGADQVGIWWAEGGALGLGHVVSRARGAIALVLSAI